MTKLTITFRSSPAIVTFSSTSQHPITRLLVSHNVPSPPRLFSPLSPSLIFSQSTELEKNKTRKQQKRYKGVIFLTHRTETTEYNKHQTRNSLSTNIPGQLDPRRVIIRQRRGNKRFISLLSSQATRNSTSTLHQPFDTNSNIHSQSNIIDRLVTVFHTASVARYSWSVNTPAGMYVITFGRPTTTEEIKLT